MERSDPFGDIEDLFETLTSTASTVPVDVVDAGDRFEVRVDLPGFEDIDVQLDGQTLTVTAQRDTTTEADAVTRERRHESVERSVRLPSPVDEEAAQATYEDGVLAVHLPKPDARGGTSIPVE